MSLVSLFTGSFRNTFAASGVFIEDQPYEKGFAEHYKSHIRKHVDSFEELRQDALEVACRRARISTPICILILIAGILILQYENFSEFSCKLTGGIVFSSFVYAFLWVYMPIDKYKSYIKDDIFPAIISFFGDYKYSPYCPNRVYKFRDHGIVPDYEIEESEDSICGNYDGVNIDLFETELEVKKRSKSRDSYVSVFKGIVIHLSMNKNFSGKTIVKRDGGAISNFLKNNFASNDLQNVKLEDPRFEKIFEVYSSDQVEARYLLTTSFMERLMELNNCYGGEGVECSFHKDKLLVMIPVKRDLFEPGSIYQAEDFVDDAKSLLKEINLIFKIIDILKLNQNIGL